MPEDKDKKTTAEIRKEQAGLGTLERVSAPDASLAPKTTIKGLNGEDIEVTDSLVATSLNAQKEAEKANKVENTIKDTYNTQLQSLGANISELEEARKKAQAGDETAQRRARSMQMVAGISDGLASLANLIGVGQGGSNIDLGTGALTPLQQRAEAARLERKADIKTIDDRLEQYRRQFDQMRMQKGSALAAYQQNKEAQEFQKEQTEKKILADMRNTEAKLLSTAMENALNRSNQLAIAKTRAAATKEAAETRAKATQATTAAKKPKEEFIITGEDGVESVYSVPKETAKAIMNDFDSIIQGDIANDTTSGVTVSAFRQAYERYQKVLSKRNAGMGSEQEVTDARKALISLSPTMQEKIKQYGTTKPSADVEVEEDEELDDVDALLESHK